MNENFKKDSNFFNNPAQHLNNIFINISRSDKSNEPKCIKQKRRFKTRIIDSDSSSTGNDSSDSKDDGEDIIHVKQKKSKIV
jgi:hypothetical protein